MKLILHFLIKYLFRMGLIILLPGIAYGQVCTGVYNSSRLCSCGIGSNLIDDCSGMGNDSNCISKINQNAELESIVESENVSPTSYNATVGTHTFSNTTEANQQYQCDWDGSKYTNARLVEVDNAPTATEVRFLGTLQEGQSLTGSYTYTDTDTDAENGTTFQWYRSDDNRGTSKAAIATATTQTYTLTNTDVGKYISFKVTPTNANATGTAVESARQYIKAGLDALAAPTDSGSALFTLQDICNRLDTGTVGSQRSGEFTEPTTAPVATGCTLNSIMQKLPLVDDSNGATPDDVTSGKTFWGLKSSDWGLQTGTKQ